MKSLPKIIISIWLLWIGFLWINVFAIDVIGDCDLVRNNISGEEKLFPSVKRRNNKTRDWVDIKHQEIIDSNSLNIAFLNLKKSCCSNKDFQKNAQDTCKADKELFSQNAPQSYYLFDHLLDVLMRRLDGIESYQEVTPDEKWEERRNFITELATNPKGTTPVNIDKTFKETRKIDPKNLLNIQVNDIGKSKQEYLSLIESWSNLQRINEYQDRTLGERYSNICSISSYMYFLFINNDQNSLFATREKILNGNCQSLIEKRLNSETEYTQLVKIKSSNELSLVNIQEYIDYLGKRTEDLQSKISKARTSFQRIERQTIKITPLCS